MALKEQDIVFTGKDTSGNTIIQMPITRAANVEDLTSTCLPLAGGTMTGAITTSSAMTLKSATNDSAVQIYGGTAYGYGGFFGIYGKEHSSRAGQFYFNANNGTANCTLQGMPNGTLTWGGKNVVFVETWSNGTSWYRKWSDGWIEQGTLITSTGDNRTITFPTAFTTTNYTVALTMFGNDNADYVPMANTKTTTSINVMSTGGGAGRNVYCYVCGY